MPIGFEDEWEAFEDELMLDADEWDADDLDHERDGGWFDDPAADLPADVDDGILTTPPAGDAEGAMTTWSAWEVGAAFALGGWLLDRHAEQVGHDVREALGDAGRVRDEPGAERGAPHPAPPSGEDYRVGTDRLQVGDRLDQGRLFSEVAAALAEERDLVLQAEGPSPAGGTLVLVVSVVPPSPGPRIWVVAEQRSGGFAAMRLLPVFQPDESGRHAVFATDHAHEAADAVVWACRREGVGPEGLAVVHRR